MDINEVKKYVPFPEIPNVYTGSTMSQYYVTQNNGASITINFDENGKLDDESVRIKYNADPFTRETIEILERKINDSAFVGVEENNDYSTSEEFDPFDPSSISIEKKIISMDTIVRRLSQNTFILNPDFQRKEVWDLDRKCKLIESLLLKIPIPLFYVSADNSDSWTVVDGLQRLSTIRDFVLGKEYFQTHDESKKGEGFRLQGLDFCGDLLNGKNMKELPLVFSNRIMETEFTFTIINPGTPEDVKRNIFKRINTGGKMLSPQEIRNALYGGASSKLLNLMASKEYFKKATCWSVKDERMEDKELILRFVSFLIRKYETYNKSQNIDDWLCDTMLILNHRDNLSTREIKKLEKEKRVTLNDVTIMSDEEIISKFKLAMERCAILFGNYAFRKSVPLNRRTPINKTLFETWGVLLSSLSDNEFNSLLNHKQRFFSEYSLLLQDYYFIIAISRDSMSKSSVNLRYEELSNLINKFL